MAAGERANSDNAAPPATPTSAVATNACTRRTRPCGAPAFLAAAKVADRAEAVSGDFFERVPAGGDVYLLCRVVFNWGDEQALQVLGACRRAMSDEALLLVIDQVVPDEDHAHGAKVNDVSLLTMGGRARTAREWTDLIEEAGLRSAEPITSTVDAAWTAIVLRRG